MDAGTQGSRGIRSRWLPLSCRHDDNVKPVGAPPPSRCLGRSRGIPPRALGPCEWTEGTTMGLLPVWRGFTHLYWYAICPATDTAGAGYHSSTLYTLRVPGHPVMPLPLITLRL